jgi:hypothetical protein
MIPNRYQIVTHSYSTVRKVYELQIENHITGKYEVIFSSKDWYSVDLYCHNLRIVPGGYTIYHDSEAVK